MSQPYCFCKGSGRFSFKGLGSATGANAVAVLVGGRDAADEEEEEEEKEEEEEEGSAKSQARMRKACVP